MNSLRPTCPEVVQIVVGYPIGGGPDRLDSASVDFAVVCPDLRPLAGTWADCVERVPRHEFASDLTNSPDLAGKLWCARPGVRDVPVGMLGVDANDPVIRHVSSASAPTEGTPAPGYASPDPGDQETHVASGDSR